MLMNYTRMRYHKSLCLRTVLHEHLQKGQDQNIHRLTMISVMVPANASVFQVRAFGEVPHIAINLKG